MGTCLSTNKHANKYTNKHILHTNKILVQPNYKHHIDNSQFSVDSYHEVEEHQTIFDYKDIEDYNV